MAHDDDRSWMLLPRSSVEWQAGLHKFIDTIFEGTYASETAPCPCSRCCGVVYKRKSEVQMDLLTKGFDENFVKEKGNAGIFLNDDRDLNVGPPDDASSANNLLSALIRGATSGNTNEEPCESAKKFFDLLKDAQQELWPGSQLTKVSFLVKLFQLKCMGGWSKENAEQTLSLWRDTLPLGHCIPDTIKKAQKIIRDLGLTYIKIDACVNDCVLFHGPLADMDTCPTCGESRWKKDDTNSDEIGESSGSGGAKKRTPCKVLRYFPLTPRLQRLYMSKETSSLMRWHKEELVCDGKMRHPADSLAWKHVNDKYKWFDSDPRNVRLGLASDGFNPFGMLNVNYTCWPVILIPYNLPPWLCLKQPYWMMSMLIPGPKSPGVNIDVYLQPLIDELHDLWVNGVLTWDEKEKKNFTLHAILLWTINDFPAYAMLSGWSTKGKFACPYCHKHTDYLWLKHGSKHCYLGHRRFLPMNHKWRRNKTSFNNKAETREAPVLLNGDRVLRDYESFQQVTFGKDTRKRKQRDEENRWHNWRKKSIFFQLPYWKSLLVRHNLDVMHIEKNICESLLGTLLELQGKCKDSEKARLDMQHLGIRPDQHPVLEKGKYTLPPALYSLGKDDKEILCKFLHGVKFPDGYAANIRRCVDVNGCKLSGLKTHDLHVILQKLLPLVVRNILPEDVVTPLMELSRFFNSLCSKELEFSEIEKLSTSIRETLCRLEMIFPPAFFDIMMHLPVHLADEARLGGLVCYRWMYPVERYLRTLKGYVKNKACPEGSIAEGYISEECLTFCSHFF